jgi:hypothetical protein
VMTAMVAMGRRWNRTSRKPSERIINVEPKGYPWCAGGSLRCTWRPYERIIRVEPEGNEGSLGLTSSSWSWWVCCTGGSLRCTWWRWSCRRSRPRSGTASHSYHSSSVRRTCHQRHQVLTWVVLRIVAEHTSLWHCHHHHNHQHRHHHRSGCPSASLAPDIGGGWPRVGRCALCRDVDVLLLQLHVPHAALPLAGRPLRMVQARLPRHREPAR